MSMIDINNKQHLPFYKVQYQRCPTEPVVQDLCQRGA